MPDSDYSKKSPKMNGLNSDEMMKQVKSLSSGLVIISKKKSLSRSACAARMKRSEQILKLF